MKHLIIIILTFSLSFTSIAAEDETKEAKIYNLKDHQEKNHIKKEVERLSTITNSVYDRLAPQYIPDPSYDSFTKVEVEKLIIQLLNGKDSVDYKFWFNTAPDTKLMDIVEDILKPLNLKDELLFNESRMQLEDIAIEILENERNFDLQNKLIKHTQPGFIENMIDSSYGTLKEADMFALIETLYWNNEFLDYKFWMQDGRGRYLVNMAVKGAVKKIELEGNNLSELNQKLLSELTIHILNKAKNDHMKAKLEKLFDKRNNHQTYQKQAKIIDIREALKKGTRR